MKGPLGTLTQKLHPEVQVQKVENRLQFKAAGNSRQAGAMSGTLRALRYVTNSAKRRLHQVAFRERVLTAYETHCALCRLRHGALLDAAHIIPDGEPDGDPEVSNGLALCKIHHAAFDLNYLGITPKLKVEVRPELLSEVDGPMLQHGIKAMHGVQILVPKARQQRPSVQRLEKRLEKFLQAIC